MRHSLWQRRVIDPLLAQLTQGTSPEKITQSLVIGSLCAFFPLLGAATPVCVAAAWIFRLNQPLVQAVNWLTAPLYLPVIFLFVRWGDWILGRTGPELNPGRLAALLRFHPSEFARQFGALAGHATVGWVAAAPLWWLVGSVLVGTPVRLIAGRLAAGRAVTYAG